MTVSSASMRRWGGFAKEGYKAVGEGDLLLEAVLFGEVLEGADEGVVEVAGEDFRGCFCVEALSVDVGVVGGGEAAFEASGEELLVEAGGELHGGWERGEHQDGASVEGRFAHQRASRPGSIQRQRRRARRRYNREGA